MPGVAAYGSRQTQRWIEQAAEAGAESVLLLPPNTYRADRETVLDHYRTAAQPSGCRSSRTTTRSTPRST